MSRQPGAIKTGGRQAGTPNKKTKLLIEGLEHYGIDPLGELAALIPLLSPKDRAGIMLQLLTFLYPKRKAVDQDLTKSRSALDDLFPVLD